MLNASLLVPLGTPDTEKAGEFDPHAGVPAHEKLNPMACPVDVPIAEAIAIVAAK
jgi:hypothetical protein